MENQAKPDQSKIPSEGYGICPACCGTKRVPATGDEKRFGEKYGWYEYDATDGTVECHNCGSQYQMGKSTGFTKLRSNGEACLHHYKSSPGKYRCYTDFKCTECGDRYYIDSGD